MPRKTQNSETSDTPALFYGPERPLPVKYEGRTESHEQQFLCKVTCFIIDKPNTPP